MTSWALQDAKARLSELVDKTASEGPQTITRRGARAAVVLSAEAYDRLAARAQPTLKELLLSDDYPRFDLDLPPRAQIQPRPIPDFDD
jgi:antitoxin Phd